ncbi:MAG TPA: Spy/CpxP family protein refolding chaperone [Phycisphaerae bacterium]|nr:Spy/CpxP family protein refolding chaperone [Phycisphaerae bacterium]
MTKRVKSVVVGSFLLALCAGTLMGVGVARLSDRPAEPTTRPQPALVTELNLSGKQQKDMEAIWSDAMQTAGPSFMDRRKAIQEERDAAIAELLPPAMLAGYDKILDKYRASLDALNAERQKTIEDAEAKTLAILSPEQRDKYKEIMKQREGGRRGGPGHRGGGPGMGPGGAGIGPMSGPGGSPLHDDLHVDGPRGAH